MISLAYGALWIFVFTVPWERIVSLPGLSIMTRGTGALAVIVALFSCVVTGRIRRWHPFHVFALLFILWAALGVITLKIQKIPLKVWTFGQLFLAVWMIWELASTGWRMRGLLLAYVLGAYVAAFDTILLFRRQGAAVRRLAAGGGDPNEFAMTLALAVPIAWYLGMTYHKPVLRWICRGYLPVALVAIGFSGSRGGLIAALTGLMIVPMTMTRLSPGRLVAAIVLLGISGSLAVAYVPDTLLHRFASTGTEVEDLRFGGRFKLWVAGIQAFTYRPLVGYGTSGFKGAITPMLGDAAQVAHNSFISVLVEEGTIGLLLFLTMLGSVLLAVLNMRSLERRFGLALAATLLVTMLPLTWEDSKPGWIIMALLVGLSQAYLTETGRLPAQARQQPVLVGTRPGLAPRPQRPVLTRRRGGPEPDGPA